MGRGETDGAPDLYLILNFKQRRRAVKLSPLRCIHPLSYTPDLGGHENCADIAAPGACVLSAMPDASVYLTTRRGRFTAQTPIGPSTRPKPAGS